MWGMTKVSINVFFYANFQAHPVVQTNYTPGTGGILGIGATSGGYTFSSNSYTYSADLMLALCEGPIVGVNQIWFGQSTFGNQFTTTGAAYGGQGVGPAVISGGNSYGYPIGSADALAAFNAAIASANEYQATATAAALEATLAAEHGDVEAQLIALAAIAAAQSAANNLYATVSLSALSLTLFDGATGQEPWGYLAATYPTQSLAYPGTAYVCAANFNLGSSASIGSLSLEVQANLVGTGANGLDADPAQVIADFLLNPQYGVGFPGANIDATTVYGPGGDASTQTYCRAMGLCFSPLLNQTETAASVLTRWLQLLSIAAVWSGDRLRFIPYGDVTVTGNGVEYVPNLTPAYALSDADLVYTSGDDPIKVSRLDPFTLPNFQWMEMLNRTGISPGYAPSTIDEPQGLPEYQATPISARDQAMIEQFGLRVGSTITAHEFCDINAACVSVQLILQRGLYVRTNFKFSLSWEFCLLDPMDIVSLADPNLGLNGYLVRVINIEEDDSGKLSVTAEELILGTSMPAINPSGTSGGSSNNTGVSVDPVNPPLIYEPPPLLTGNVSQLWVGASGGSGGVADPNWGGCAVWASLDGETFIQIAKIVEPLKQGFLTAPLASASGYDTVDTLAVGLAESGGALATATQTAAQGGQTLCLVDGELLGFATATLTGTDAYNVTGLARGLYGTAPAAHLTGAAFARLDSAVTQYVLPANWIGQLLFLKFQSFNIYGSGVQDIATCIIYTYIPSGAGVVGPVTTSLELGQDQDWGLASAPAGIFDDWGTVGGAVSARVDLGNVSG
jgi:hypothetical protein